MAKLSQYRVLIFGIVSPLMALFLYTFVYVTLTRSSTDRDKDWLFRLSLSTLAMTAPFIITFLFALSDRRRHALSVSAKVGLAVAILSLGLTWRPVRDGMNRWKQSRNLAMRDVAAPLFNTLDLDGNTQRLGDHKGEVVLVNIWATWCPPCREEMPKLDQLYRERKAQGFIVFGLSDEDAGLQRRFVAQFPVSYPLLTVTGRCSRPLSRHRALPSYFSD